jgi:acyl dehydratase
VTSPGSSATIAPGVVGIEAGPILHEIDARWLMGYAAGLGEHDARFFDTLAADGPLAHPLFPVCYEWPVAVALRERAVAPELQSRSVHATHHLVIHRAPRAGDRLRTTGRVVALQPRRSGALIVARFETLDAAGHPVTTTDYGSVYRGVALDGVPESRPGDARPGSVSLRPSSTERAAPAPTPEWASAVDVSTRAAWTYTECARIFNPIHTDVAVARAAGLAAPILHGTATLAMAVSRVLSRGGDPRAVCEVSATFTGMVPMPSTLSVRGRSRQDDTIVFDVVSAAGTPVLVEGRVRFRSGG